MNFIFFTKTNWNEAPRIRHQLATLLHDAGHKVYFIQKPKYLLWKFEEKLQDDNGIILLRINELIHHKLRIFKWIHLINSVISLNSIRKLQNRFILPGDSIIINFNYEYYFLRKSFANNKIFTIINDDFVSRALPGSRRILAWAQEMTCKNSNEVLAVSDPLVKSLSGYCSPRLFLPWADCSYRKAQFSIARNILLFWGYINHRLDFDLIKEWSKKLTTNGGNEKIIFVGPIAAEVNNNIAELSALSNVQFESPSKLDALPIQNILAGIIPYKNGNPKIDAITLSNKALQILARGIPLLISGMPNFINKSFIFRHEQDICKSVYQLKKNFDLVQPEIESFIEINTGETRIKQLMRLLTPTHQDSNCDEL